MDANKEVPRKKRKPRKQYGFVSFFVCFVCFVCFVSFVVPIRLPTPSFSLIRAIPFASKMRAVGRNGARPAEIRAYLHVATKIQGFLLHELKSSTFSIPRLPFPRKRRTVGNTQLPLRLHLEPVALLREPC